MNDSKYSVEVPDIDYWKKQIKCQYACPVHTDSRGYVRAIAEGDYEKACLIARGPNPLASICGRICGTPCEAESKKYAKNPLEIIQRFLSMDEDECKDVEDIKNFLKHFKNPASTNDAPTVGIVGSGPAGLATAHDLCLMGIKPTIYEMEPVPAGMLYLGVPEYRLPCGLIEAEVEVIDEELKEAADSGLQLSP